MRVPKRISSQLGMGRRPLRVRFAPVAVGRADSGAADSRPPATERVFLVASSSGFASASGRGGAPARADGAPGSPPLGAEGGLRATDALEELLPDGTTP